MSLLGRLEVLGPGATAAAWRRWQAAELESCWRREERDNKALGLRFNLSAVKICNLCITVQLREAGWEEAARVFRFCHEQSTVMPGQLDDPVLKTLMEQTVVLKDQELAIEIATYAQTMGSQGAIALALAVSDGFELGPSQKEYLNKLFATEAQWKPI